MIGAGEAILKLKEHLKMTYYEIILWTYTTTGGGKYAVLSTGNHTGAVRTIAIRQ